MLSKLGESGLVYKNRHGKYSLAVRIGTVYSAPDGDPFQSAGSLGLCQRALAAHFAISVRLSGDNFAARTSPPLKAALAVSLCAGVPLSILDLSVAIRMTWTALPMTSAGRFWPWAL